MGLGRDHVARSELREVQRGHEADHGGRGGLMTADLGPIGVGSRVGVMDHQGGEPEHTALDLLEQGGVGRGRGLVAHGFITLAHSTASGMVTTPVDFFSLPFLCEPLAARRGRALPVTGRGLARSVGARSGAPPRGERFALGLAGAIAAALAWAGSLVVLTPAMGTLDPVTAQAVRLPLAGVVLLATPWGWEAPRHVRAADRATLWRVVLLGLLTAASSVLFVTGIKWTEVAVAAVLSSTAPLFALPLGLIFLRERVTGVAVAGTVITLAGLAILQL